MKKIVCGVLGLALILCLLSACGGPAFDPEAFKDQVQESRELINKSTLDVANVANYQINYYTMLGRVDESGVASGFDWLEQNSGTTRADVDADYAAIRQQYKDIVLIERDGTEADEIMTAYEDLYNAYVDFYALVTGPVGTPDSFTANMIDCGQRSIDAEDSLALWLD